MESPKESPSEEKPSDPSQPQETVVVPEPGPLTPEEMAQSPIEVLEGETELKPEPTAGAVAPGVGSQFEDIDQQIKAEMAADKSLDDKDARVEELSKDEELDDNKAGEDKELAKDEPKDKEKSEDSKP